MIYLINDLEVTDREVNDSVIFLQRTIRNLDSEIRILENKLEELKDDRRSTIIVFKTLSNGLNKELEERITNSENTIKMQLTQEFVEVLGNKEK